MSLHGYRFKIDMSLHSNIDFLQIIWYYKHWCFRKIKLRKENKNDNI